MVLVTQIFQNLCRMMCNLKSDVKTVHLNLIYKPLSTHSFLSVFALLELIKVTRGAQKKKKVCEDKLPDKSAVN